ncbi:MAG: PAS domain-containing protein [Rhodobacteraceae bacterium]|nr:PAS domain-containing protein [Paracoccaceae bacterium]
MSAAIDGIIWRADADTLRFEYVYGSVREILGYSAEDWLAEDGFWQSKLHPEDADRIIAACVDLSRQRLPRRLTYRMIAADGRAVWLQDNVKVEVDGPRARLTGIMIDVTALVEERRQVDSSRRQNAHSRALYDLVPVAIWEEEWSGVVAELRNLRARGIADIRAHADRTPGFVESMLARLQVVAVNPGAVEMFRAADAADLIARASAVIDADRPNSVFITALDAILRDERRIEGVNTLRRLDGAPVHVHYRIALPGIEDRTAHAVICEMDISEAHTANERFELVTRATSDVIWDFDIVADTLWASDGLQRIFGLDPAVMLDGLDRWTARIHPEDIDRVMTQFDAILNRGSDVWEQEYRFRKGDGSDAWVRDEGFVLRDAQGAAVRMVGSLVDITEQRKLEERLLQSQKLEAMGKLTGGMAHDFNNLLTVVLGSLEALEDRIGADAEARQHLQVANRAVDRSAQMISQLLSYARQQPMAPQTIDMASQVGDMRQTLARTLGEQITLAVEGAPDLWMCRADPGQLESALLNLCINARDAMPGGGRLTIGMRNAQVAADDPLAEQGLAPGGYAVLSVSDTGHGMDTATLQAAFDPFFTTKEVGAGSGLGLSMVQGFAHQSKGIAQIRSEPGRGTVVELYLPARPVAAPDAAARAAPAAERLHGAGHVLLLEDQDMVRTHVVKLLDSLGYSVTPTGTVAAAAEVLASDRRIDLVLADIVLPGGESGFDLARQVAALRPCLPVIFTSGYHASEDDAGKLLQPGRNFLRKPYRRNDLATLLQQALGKN